MLSIRQQKMLVDLIEKNDYMKMDDFKQKYGISVRTARYDLLLLENWLQDNNIVLERNRKSGVLVHVNDSQRALLIDQLQVRPSFIEAKERVKLIVKQLLEVDKLPAEQFMEDYQISRNTFLHDLQTARQWLEKYQLKLIREQGFVFIKGKEHEVRRAYLELLREELTEEKIIQLLLSDNNSKITGLPWSEWFQLEEIHALYEVVLQLEQRLGIEFSDSSFSALVLHLLMAVERLKAGNIIKMDDGLLLQLQETNEFKLIDSIISTQLTELFQIKPPKGEIGYITQHVQGAQREQESSQEDQIYVQYAKQIVFEVERRLHHSLVDRNKVINGLAIHLKPAFYRYKYQLQYENPLLLQMETMYGPILALIEEVVHSIFAPLVVKFDRHETSYIALHICSGLDQTVLPYKKKVALVCSSGLGTAAILQRKLLTLYPQVIVMKKLSYKELKMVGGTIDVDLILSTIDVPFPLSAPVINVSPLLQGEDQRNLIPYIGEPRTIEQEEGKVIQAVKEIIAIVNKHSTVHEKQELTSSLFSYLIGQSTKDTKKKLTHFLSVDSITLQHDSNDWLKVIEHSNKLLIESGSTNEEYTKVLIRMSKEPNHHFIITEGVAFPHAAPEHGVFETGFSIVTLKEPIKYGGREDLVWLIITMAAVDQYQHITALATILDALNDKDFIKLLRYTTDVNQIWQSLQEKEGPSE